MLYIDLNVNILNHISKNYQSFSAINHTFNGKLKQTNMKDTIKSFKTGTYTHNALFIFAWELR